MNSEKEALLQYLNDCQDEFRGKIAEEVELRLQTDWPTICVDICTPSEEPVFFHGVAGRLACVIRTDTSGKVDFVTQLGINGDSQPPKHRTVIRTRRSTRTQGTAHDDGYKERRKSKSPLPVQLDVLQDGHVEAGSPGGLLDGVSPRPERARRKSHLSTKGSPKSGYKPEGVAGMHEKISPLLSPGEDASDSTATPTADRHKSKALPPAPTFEFPTTLEGMALATPTEGSSGVTQTKVPRKLLQRRPASRGSLMSPSDQVGDTQGHSQRRSSFREALSSPTSDQITETHRRTQRRPSAQGSLRSPASDQAETHGRTQRRPSTRASLGSPVHEAQGKRKSIRSSRLRISTPPPDGGSIAHHPRRGKPEEPANVVNVYCCVPPIPLEEARCLQQLDSKSVKFIGVEPLCFTFDAVFYPGSKDIVFDRCKDIVHGVVEGRDGNIFVLGQEDTEKPLTMFGWGESDVHEVDEFEEFYNISGLTPLIPSSFKEVFKELESKTAGPDYYCVTCSVLEIQTLPSGDCVCSDLLDHQSDTFRQWQRPRRALTREEGHSLCQSLHQEDCLDAYELMECVQQALRTRANGAGIVILTIRVVSENEETLERTKGRLVLCELHDRISAAKATASLELAALRDVLCGIQASPPIRPETDRILPNVLSNSLDASIASRTAFFLNCSPRQDDEVATLQTLQYGACVDKASKSNSRPVR